VPSQLTEAMIVNVIVLATVLASDLGLGLRASRLASTGPVPALA
jgi:hypothetical protein